ncbi:hypothetical protein QCA50_014226 [Cerrena zonata]|uniref:VWFA domain-containing protein n=1 Tax=Cerrena zonata TaxID=2478898 RepID=A0AAW0FPQ5_9APHY
MSRSFHGIVYEASAGEFAPVTLRSVTIQISAIDTSAVISFKQIFAPALDPAPPLAQSYYVFPLPPRSNICKFKISGLDGRSVTAVVMELNQGHALHSDTRAPFFVENAFVVSLGKTNIAQTLEVELTYVCELDTEESETRIEVPAYIGSTYLTQGDSSSASPGTLGSPRVHILTRIQMATKRSLRVYSVNHASDTTLLPSPGDGQAIVKYTSTTFMENNFALVIQTSAPNDTSRCFAERRLDDPHSVAMHLTFVPQFLSETRQSQEYIFIIDRSGSMTGSRILQARNTLNMLLHALPLEDTTFNVFSFGSTCHSIFSHSFPRTEKTLQSAVQQVGSMNADLGGTSMYGALSNILPSRNFNVPTSIFLLTDGGPTDNTAEVIIDLVSNAVSQSTPIALLRVFTLGIECSSPKMEETCRGIARAGRGECAMVTNASSIMGEFGRLFHIGRTFVLRNVTIDWGLPRDAGLHGAIFQQVPNAVPDLYPGRTALIACALIRYHDFVIPEYVIVKGQKDGLGDFVEYKVPVTEIQWLDWIRFPLLHNTAARRIIADKERDAEPQGGIPDSDRDAVVQLAQQHQLVTRFTRFAPVETFEKPPSPSPPLKKSHSSGKYRHNFRLSSVTPLFSSRRNPLPSNQSSISSPPFMTQIDSGASLTPGPHNISVTSASPVITQRPTAVRDRAGQGSQVSPATPMQRDAPLASSSSPVRAMGTTVTAAPSDPDPHMVISYDPAHTAPADLVPVDNTPSSPIDADAQRLIQLRSADGSWGLSPQFTQIVGQHPFDSNNNSLLDERLWWTALAITYLRTRLRDQPNYLQLFVPDSMKFGHRIAAASGDDFDEILRLANATLNRSAPDSSALAIVSVAKDEDEDGKAESKESDLERPSSTLSRRKLVLHACAFISLIIPFILLLIASLSSSILKDVPIFVVKIDCQGSKAKEFHFGLWGVCVEGLSNVPFIGNKLNGSCSVTHTFYSIPPGLFEAVGHPELSGIMPHRLMKVLILHPIAVALAYPTIYVPLIIMRTKRRAVLYLLLVILTTVVSSIAFAADVAVVIVARNRTNAVQSGGVTVHVGNAVWIMFSAVLMYWWSVILITLALYRAHRSD